MGRIMKHYFETTAGEKVGIKPIALVDLQLIETAVHKEFKDNPFYKPPTYQIEVLGGEVETHEHTNQTIEEGTDSDKEKWANYLEVQSQIADEIASRTAYVFLDGMDFDLPSDDKWIKRRLKLFGEIPPSGEDELKLYYVDKVLLKTPADLYGIRNKIIEVSMDGASEEVIEAFLSLFRSPLEKSQRAEITKPQDNE